MAMEFSIHCRNFGLHAPFLFASATPVLHEGKRTEVLVIPTCAGMTGERSHRNSEVVRFSLHHRACHEERSSKPWDAALISDAADSVSVSSSVPRCSQERALTGKHERFVAEESVSGYSFQRQPSGRARQAASGRVPLQIVPCAHLPNRWRR